jgi:hypothetical protein
VRPPLVHVGPLARESKPMSPIRIPSLPLATLQLGRYGHYRSPLHVPFLFHPHLAGRIFGVVAWSAIAGLVIASTRRHLGQNRMLFTAPTTRSANFPVKILDYFLAVCLKMACHLPLIVALQMDLILGSRSTSSSRASSIARQKKNRTPLQGSWLLRPPSSTSTLRHMYLKRCSV